MSWYRWVAASLLASCSLTTDLDDLSSGAPCPSNMGECDGDTSTSCETRLDDDVENCGACGHRCAAEGATCEAGSCALDCDTGLANCDGDVGTGCETVTDTDIAHCGACGHPCDAPNETSVTCVAGDCNYACNASRGDCNEDLADGCEINLLIDSEHCGQCGHQCKGTGCTTGSCSPVALADDADQPLGLTIDFPFVYWAEYGSGSIRRVEVMGLELPCAVRNTRLMIDEQPGPAQVAVDNDVLYWTNFAGGDVRSLEIGNGPVLVPQILASGYTNAADLEVKFGWVYFSSVGSMGSNATGTIARVTTTGTTVEDLADNLAQPWGLTVHDGTIYFAAQGNSDIGGGLFSLPLTGGTPTALYADQNDALFVVTDGNQLFWTEHRPGGTVMRGSILDPMPPLAIHDEGGQPRGITIAGEYVYWTVRGLDKVFRRAVSDETDNELIASGQGNPYIVAVGGGAVYWTNHGDGRVMCAPL